MLDYIARQVSTLYILCTIDYTARHVSTLYGKLYGYIGIYSKRAVSISTVRYVFTINARLYY